MDGNECIYGNQEKQRERKREIAIPKYMSTYILKENFVED